MSAKTSYIVAAVSTAVGIILYFISSLMGVIGVSNDKTLIIVFFVLASIIIINACVFWIIYLFKKRNVVT